MCCKVDNSVEEEEEEKDDDDEDDNDDDNDEKQHENWDVVTVKRQRTNVGTNKNRLSCRNYLRWSPTQMSFCIEILNVIS